MTTVADTSADRAALLEERQQRLASRVSALGRRGAAATRDRLLLIVGSALIVLGVAAIILGWVGASDTVAVFEQVPFLISGGLLGLALVFIGTFTFFAYWLTIVVRENRELRRQATADREELRRQQELLIETLTAIRDALESPRRPTE